MPRTRQYLTLMDRFTLVCLVCILATIVELVYAHRLTMNDRMEAARRTHERMRWIMPLLFVICLTVSMLLSF